jgi:tetratricopeptide (TPR) repeat protein
MRRTIMGLTPLQENGATRSTGGCPDAELLASYIEGRVTPEERIKVEAHLARCEECYFTFSETVLEQQAEGTTSEEPASRSRLRRWLPQAAAGLAAAACVVIVVQVFQPFATRGTELQIALNQLDAATGAYRKFEPRLTLIPTYRQLEPAMRSAAPGAEAPLAVREAALNVEKASANAGVVAPRALAAKHLALGEPERAVRALAPSAQSDDAGLLSDLAASYLARNGAGDVQRALDLLERAVRLDPNRTEAWFNLGLAAEATGQRSRAMEAWTRTLALDSTSGWANEARTHLENLKVP